MKNRKTRNRRRGGALLALLLLTAVLITGCGTGISDPTTPDTKPNTQPETKKENTSDMTQDTTKRAETTTAPQNQTEAKQKGYVVVTDTVKADGSTDVTKALQELIDANPEESTAPAIKASVQAADNYRADELPIDTYDDFEKAVRGAAAVAQEGDSVLMSPASASFDIFKNFMERGNRFKDIVNSL